MRLLKKTLIVTLIFCNSIYSQEVSEEKPKKKLKNYFISGLCLSYSLYYFSEANGSRKLLINFENTSENLYRLGAIADITQPPNNEKISNLGTIIISEGLLNYQKYYKEDYQFKLNSGAFWGVMSALYFYFEYRKDISNTEIKSMITPILNLNSKSAEIGVSFRF